MEWVLQIVKRISSLKEEIDMKSHLKAKITKAHQSYPALPFKGLKISLSRKKFEKTLIILMKLNHLNDKNVPLNSNGRKDFLQTPNSSPPRWRTKRKSTKSHPLAQMTLAMTILKFVKNTISTTQNS